MSDRIATQPGTEPLSPDTRALGPLILLSLINFLNQVDRRALVTLFPLIKTEWGVSDTYLGLAVSLFTAARALTVLPAGWLGDKKGTLRILRPSVFVWSALAAVSGWAGKFAAFVGLRTGVGALDGVNNPLDLAYLGKISPPARRGINLAIYSAALYIGSGIGVIYAGAIGERFGWRLALTLPGALALLLAVGFLRLPKTSGRQEKVAPLGGLRDFSWLQGRGLLVIFLSSSLGMFASTALVSWLPSYLTRYYVLSLTDAGLITGGLIIPATLCGTLLGGRLSDRLGAKNTAARYWIAFSGLTLAMILGLAGLLLSDLTATMVLLFLASFCFTVPVSPMLVLVQESVPPERLATTQALFGLVSQMIGAAPATGLVGLLSDRIGLQTALILPFLAAGLGGILIWYAGWKARKLKIL